MRRNIIAVFMCVIMVMGAQAQDKKLVILHTNDTHSTIVPLNENLLFPLSGTYHFEIEQAMREPVLKGISDIGLYIDKQ